MKKALTLILLTTLLLSLCACAHEQSPQELVQPFDFYYRTAQTDFTSLTGPIGVETRDLGETALTDEALITLYLQGPESEELLSPFPPNVRLVDVRTGSALISVKLSAEYANLQGVDASIADACITRTLLGLGSVRRVRIASVDESGAELRSVTLDNSDILLADHQTDTGNLDCTLYFADAEGRYLLAEKRSIAALPAADLPKYLTEQLLRGPQTAGLYPTIPLGTVLLDVNVENGICAVDLSAEFTKNCDALGLPPHLTLLSITNTLTELDGVDSVQFYVEGKQDVSYGSISLAQEFTAEMRVVGPSHPDWNEQDCVLYLPASGTLQFYPLPLRVRSGSNESAEQTLLRALFSYAPQNGLENPWFDQPTPQTVTLEGGVCTLDFAEDTIPGETAAARALALRILYVTLSADESVDQVLITVNGELVE